ncbi:MAG: UDP-N-acetylmuramoyl-L-alanine--D-glutamate ligase, partial [Rikenellaceae bacterium]
MKKIVILGGGISGYGSAILAKKEGFDVFLSDKGHLAERYVALLREWGVEFEQGGHSVERIMAADEVIKSPGIPDSAELVCALRAQGTPVISEIEFAGRYLRGARTICITGSNGKTTTTSLVYRILCEAGYRVALGGNIGESFAYSVATREVDWYVLEISSFQLDGMFDFRADISVLMNITPDHLDRYGYKFENYAASKMRIVRNQGADDSFVYLASDATIAAAVERGVGGVGLLPFDASLIDEEGVITLPDGLRLECDRMQIKGLHNNYNAMAAAMAARAAGVSQTQIQHSIYAFSPVEHRLEPAGEIDGVAYINDSKATNVDSVWYALESLTRPAVWIAGGTDKGNDYEPLKAFAAAKVHTLVCMGVDNGALECAFSGVVPTIISTSSLAEAMAAARGAAHRGDVVILSPACASFDLFNNYEHRGEMFKEWVK